ncbi:MAG: hypothetical protein JST91_16795 [Actinobacteria bacterium]|nr:hypothetical protein [Actinomycetota bacterium]
MKSFTFTALTVGVIATASMGLAAAANAAPSGPTTADQTIGELQSQGFQVIVNKVGAQPLSQCNVSAVRPQTLARMDSGAPGAMDDIVTTVTSMVAYVDVVC